MKVLIATDGSDFSNAAVEECCQKIIRPGETEIMVASACEDYYPVAPEPFAMSQEYYENLSRTMDARAEESIDSGVKIIKRHFSNGSVSLTKEVLHGYADQKIVEKAREWKADLIVVGSHGRGFWGRLLGSISDGVVHHAPCSVLVVRPRE